MGIDLGTSTNLVAQWTKDGATLCNTADGASYADSAVALVSYNNNVLPVAGSAATYLLSSGHNAVPNPKRLIASANDAGDLDKLRESLVNTTAGVVRSKHSLAVRLEGARAQCHA